jgi:23S rRNA pseudouridine2605 synthase
VDRRSARLRKIGLARSLSKLGYCSRSQAAQLIRAGRVRLNGRVRHDPEAPVNETQDCIEVDGRPIANARRIYLVMNKPRGVVTTASDEKGRQTVYDLLGDEFPWLSPVGRLDKASEGLLLLTNDSEWAARVLNPETHLDKTYHVQIAALAGDDLVRKITGGIRTKSGKDLKVKRAQVLRSGKRNCWLEVVLDEGKNRQIRRLFEALGIEVLRLIRVAIGPLALGTLAKGAWRELQGDEKRLLDHSLVKG